MRNHAAVGERIDRAAFRLAAPKLGRRSEQHTDDTVPARVAPNPAPVAVDDQLVPAGSLVIAAQLRGLRVLGTRTLALRRIGSGISAARIPAPRVSDTGIRSTRTAAAGLDAGVVDAGVLVACPLVPLSLHAAHGRSGHRQERGAELGLSKPSRHRAGGSRSYARTRLTMVAPGLVGSSTDPVVRYLRAVHQRQPGLLSPAEVDELAEFPSVTPQPAVPSNPLNREEQLLVQLLNEDGRRTNEDLAALSGMSDATVRRRIDTLRRSGRLYLRAVVEPALLGLPVEALLWLRVHPRFVDDIGKALIQSNLVRYAAATTGEYQHLVHVAVPDRMALHEFTTSGSWTEHVDMVETSMLLAAPKRTGILHPTLRHTE